ncbi:MAG: CBS domain-containing protein [Nitrososphaerota archaeon]
MVSADVLVEDDRMVREAAIIMDRKHCGCLLVTSEGKAVGIVTERDLVRRVLATGIDSSQVKVKDVMSYPLVTIDPDAALEDAVLTMAAHGFRRLPVVDKDRQLIGLITITEAAETLALTQTDYSKLLAAVLSSSKPPESMMYR